MKLFILTLSLILASTSLAYAQRDRYYGVAPEKLIAAGAKYMERAEVMRLLSGRTELWDTGGRAFYGPDGSLTLRFNDGARADGKWRVSGDGTMCTMAPRAAPEATYCHRYMRLDGRVYYVWRGKVRSIQRTRGGKAF